MEGVIIIPYRDRQVHLDVLLLYLNKYFGHIPVVVCEQRDSSHWNKGLLFNAAYLEVGHQYDYMILHDVDFVPAKNVDYSYTSQPTLLATECSQFNYQHCYPNFFGGVVGISREHYLVVNGFSNKFRGWGGEDDDFRRRIITKGIYTDIRKGNRFENFIHPRLDVLGIDKSNPDYNHNLSVLQGPVDESDGLSSTQYEVMSNQLHKECRHLRIKTTI